MHETKRIYSATAMMGILALGLGVPTAKAETVLRMNNWLPPQHAMLVGCVKPWIEQVAEATDGRVKIELTGSSLGAPPRQYDMVEQGIVDIALGAHGYTPGRFDLTGVAELPFKGESGEARSVAFWRVNDKLLGEAGEYDNVKLLALYTTGTGIIMTSNKAVTSLDDYNGLKFRVGGGLASDINQKLGGVNVAAPAGEVREMMSQGVVDGTLLAPETYNSFDFKNVVNYRTEFPGGFYAAGFFIVMNQQSFDKLDQQDQEDLMSVSGENLSRLCGEAIDKADAAGFASMDEDGVQKTIADEAFTASVRERLAPLEAAWIEKANAKGIDGPAAVKMFESEVEQVMKSAE